MLEKRIVESGPGPDAAFALAAIVDSPVAAIVGKSLNGIVTSWNREAERIFLYAAAEMIGPRR
jgi:PAS domain S-box-containing protein